MAWQRDGGIAAHASPVLVSDPRYMADVPCLEMICLDHPTGTGFKVLSQVTGFLRWTLYQHAFLDDFYVDLGLLRQHP